MKQSNSIKALLFILSLLPSIFSFSQSKLKVRPLQLKTDQYAVLLQKQDTLFIYESKPINVIMIDGKAYHVKRNTTIDAAPEEPSFHLWQNKRGFVVPDTIFQPGGLPLIRVTPCEYIDSIIKDNIALKHIVSTVSFNGHVSKADYPAYLLFTRRYLQMVNDHEKLADLISYVDRYKRKSLQLFSN